jgi:hypothetical protein
MYMERTPENRSKIRETGRATRARRAGMTCKVFELKVQMNKLAKKQEECLKMQFVEAK